MDYRLIQFRYSPVRERVLIKFFIVKLPPFGDCRDSADSGVQKFAVGSHGLKQKILNVLHNIYLRIRFGMKSRKGKVLSFNLFQLGAAAAARLRMGVL